MDGGGWIEEHGLALIEEYGLVLATVVICFASGFLPFVNTEFYLLLVGSVLPDQLGPVVLLATAAQMGAKSVVYFAGRGVITLPKRKVQARLDEAHRRIEAWRWGTPAFLTFTAVIGLPPYYLVSFLAGTLRYNFLLFLVTGLIGRGIRFGAVAYAPWMFESLLG